MTDPYREKYVAFVDMLGFSALVQSTADDPKKRAKIVAAMDRLSVSTCENPALGMNLTYFSDCIVISTDLTEAGLYEILESLTTIAENLLQIDILVRGGLTLGNIHHDGQFMFGPAMLEAYGMECRETIFPTILVSESVKADCDRYSWGGLCLVHDSEQPERQFVHYLRRFDDYDPTPVAGKVLLDKPAKLIRHYIAKRLAGPPGAVRDKAVWLKTYWDDTAGKSTVLGKVNPVADLAEQTYEASGYRIVRRILG